MANKLFVVALLCSSIAFAQCGTEFVQHPTAFVHHPEEPVIPSRFRVINSQFQQNPNLEYSFDQQFETGDTFAEEGSLRNIHGQDVIVTKGSYTTLEQDGSMVRIDYVADEHGFRVVGSTPISSV